MISPLIDPKLAPKFSPNLHAWVRKFERTYSVSVSAYVDPRTDFHERQRIHLGYRFDGEVIGVTLSTTLWKGARKESGCWMNSRGWPDLPGFWPGYIRWGRCYIDPQHKTDFIDSRWKTSWTSRDGESRTCLWCGRREVERVWTETKLHTYSRWEAA